MGRDGRQYADQPRLRRRIVDAAGNAVSVVGMDGAVYVQGDSEYTVTVGNYAETCDLTGAGEITGWDASVMPM